MTSAPAPGARYKFSLSAQVLGVTEPRAALTRKMVGLLTAITSQAVLTLASEIMTWTRRRDGMMLAPNTRLSMLTALLAGFSVLSGAKFTHPLTTRLERRLKAELLLHVRKQAIPLTLAHFHALVRDFSLPLRAKHAVILAWSAGFRIGDLGKLEHRDVSWPEPHTVTLRCRGLKGQTPGSRSYWRHVPLIGAASLLLGFLSTPQAPQTKLFPIPSEALRREVIAVLRRFDHRYSAHSVRRGVATALANQGISEFIIRDFLGHKDVSSTRLYIAPSPKQRNVRRMIAAVASVL